MVWAWRFILRRESSTIKFEHDPHPIQLRFASLDRPPPFRGRKKGIAFLFLPLQGGGSDPDFRGVIESNLTQAGHRAFVASSGNAGLKLAGEVRPDVVLLDLVLHDMPGISVAKELQRDPETRRIPIVMVAALSPVLNCLSTGPLANPSTRTLARTSTT